MASAGGDGSVNTWTVKSIVGTMFPLLIVLSILEMGSGFVLEALQETYLGNPTLLVLVPVMIGMGGNLGAILSSRLSTRLHLGLLEFDPLDVVLWRNIGAIVALAVTIFTMLGFVAWGAGHLITGEPLPLVELLLISVASGMMLVVVVIFLSIGATYVSYTRGLDPDDTTIPVVTNLCDILGVVILSVVAIAILGGPSLHVVLGETLGLTLGLTL